MPPVELCKYCCVLGSGLEVNGVEVSKFLTEAEFRKQSNKLGNYILKIHH